METVPVSSLAEHVLAAARALKLTIGTVESCTGGLIAGALTAIPGSSDVVMGGLVTYSNAMKSRLAAVPAILIDNHGAVSAVVAAAMAEGGRASLEVDLCVSATGVAGPGGGSPQKPVGLVYLALARSGHTARVHELRLGDIGRDQVRAETVRAALHMFIEAIATPSAA